MKKLLLEDLQVESFATTAQPAGRGTVMGHATEAATCAHTCPATCGLNGNSCGIQCATMAPMESCAPANCGDSFSPQCPGTGTIGGTSEGSLCATRNCSENSCTGPYGCGCTTTMSFDYTFCQTMCC